MGSTINAVSNPVMSGLTLKHTVTKPVWLCRLFALLAFWLVVTLVSPGALAANAANTRAAVLRSQDFPPVGENFDAHIAAAREYVERHQMHQRRAQDVSYNLPFQFAANTSEPYRGRFLLIHGLNDSPYVWADLGQTLADMGFDVRALLLPGHGTTPKAMLDVDYRDWLAVTRQHIELWQRDTKRVTGNSTEQDATQGDSPLYLGGFSLGGVIATIMALENESIEGLLLVSPAWHSKLNHLLRWSGLYQRFNPWVFGGMIIEDNPAKYNSIPINSATQYYKTSRYLKRRWRNRRLAIPAVVVATADDSVVDVDYMRRLYRKRFTARHRAFVLYGNDTSTGLLETEVRRLSADLDRRIINQSHLSLINQPDNELFGAARSILVCNGNDPATFFGCMRSNEHWFGAQHTPSPDGVAVARTTYNPDYDYVVETIRQVFTAGSH